jgi:hypothetical protein
MYWRRFINVPNIESLREHYGRIQVSPVKVLHKAILANRVNGKDITDRDALPY